MNHYLHVKADDAAEAIENYISMHNLNPHDRIPSERAMAEELGIKEMSISISHEEEMAITVVVMAGGHHEVHHDG